MNTIVFLLFLAATVYYVWSGKFFNGKKSLAGTGKSFIGVFIGIVIIGFILKALVAIIPGFTRNAAGDLMEALGASLVVVWGMRFLIVAISNIFSGIMEFHKKYNAANYSRFSPALGKLAPVMLFLIKCIVSLGSVVIFYGIWLAH